MADEPTTTPGPSTGATAQKRAAGSDLTQPADKKAKTVRVSFHDTTPPTHQTEMDSGLSRPGGILNLLANRFSSPFPVMDTQYVNVNTAGMNGYFSSLRESLIRAVYPDARYQPNQVITEDNFRLVCRYLVKARIDHVYASYSGRRTAIRIAIPREFEVPKALADLTNAVGVHLCGGGAFAAVPEPEAAAGEANQNLQNLVTFAILTGFSTLVQAAKVRNFIRTSYISSSVEGTAWWLLTARSTADPAVVADGLDSASIFGTFKEWTPADGIMSAIVQRGNNGITPADATLAWSMDRVTGISGLRNSFNLDA